MKKTLLTNLNLNINAALVMMLSLFGGMLSAQVDCDVVTVSCNDLVTISLNDDCQITVAHDMVLEDPSALATYSVEVQDASGATLPTSPIVDGSYEGDTLTVKVTMLDCSITCWGNIIVKDKLKPIIDDCPAIVLDCNDSAPVAGDANFQEPTVTDNCVGSIVWTYVDQPHGQMCDDGFCTIIDRVWTATDVAGNTATCTQEIRFNTVSVDDVDLPSDYIVDYNSSDACSVLDIEGISPSISGTPTNYDCACLQFSYSDVPFEMCGAGTKILRNWFVIDWCTGEYVEGGQNIEAFDDEPPVITCGESCITLYTPENECTLSYTYPVPVQLGSDGITPQYSDCSDVTWTLSLGSIAGGFSEDLSICGGDFDPCEIDADVIWTVVPAPYTVDLEPGFYWFRYDFVDECGNQMNAEVGSDNVPGVGYCTKDVVVRDGTKPYAIAEGVTQMTLDESCEVILLAESMDDGSFDNCGGSIVSYMIKRVGSTCDGHSDDDEYGPSVAFCQSDVGQEIQVMLQVTDECDNTDEAVGIVIVDGFDDATYNCPTTTSYTFTCTEWAANPTFNAAGDSPTFVNSTCGNSTTNYTMGTPSLSSDPTSLCGNGTVIRSIPIMLNGTTVFTCTQTITITAENTSSLSGIECPEDVNLISCNTGYEPEDLNSIATATATEGCSNIEISHQDGAPFQDVDQAGACYSIIREWTAIDWCTYDPDNPTEGIYTCSQQLNFTSSQGPTMLTCDDVTVNDDDNNCQHYVTLTITSTDGDGCTPDDLIIYTWEVDLDKDGDIDHSGSGSDASGTYPVGVHNVTFYAKDACGLTEACTYMFTITNNSAPTPICRAELVWAIGPDGTTEVWASDFDIKSEAGCGQSSALTFSFTADGNTQALEFTCDDLPNGIGAEISLNMYVIDGLGQVEFCQVTLILQDNLDVCTDDNNRMAFVSGKVYDENFAGVENFEVALEDMSDDEMYMELTDSEGDYMFESVEYYDAYEVAPIRNDLPKEGVSTLDLVLIQRHILNLESLDSPYKMIAADANKSYTITSADMVDIRKLILDEYDAFPSNNSWQFVDANHQFIDPTMPWDYTTSVSIPQLYIDYADVEFVAIKTGDVNNSVSLFLTGDDVENRGSESFTLVAKDQAFEAGDIVTVALSAKELVDIYGIQFTADYDGSVLSYEGYNVGQLAVNVDNVGLSRLAQGQITMSCDFAYGREIVEGVEMVSLVFTAQADGTLSDVFGITSDVTAAELYTTEKEVLDLNLEFGTDVGDEASSFVLYQNEPNPFALTTTIPFYLGNAGNVSLEVYNAEGRVLYNETMQATKGNNTFIIDSATLNNHGVLFYRVESETTSAIRKMIVLK